MSLKTDIQPPGRDEELTRLGRALELARGFRLYFVQSLPGADRESALATLSGFSEGRCVVYPADKAQPNLRMALQDLVKSKHPRVICVTGLESFIEGNSDGVRSAFVQNLNHSRDLFRETVPCSVVLFGAEHVIRAIQEGAPDFFSVASGIYILPNETPISFSREQSDRPVGMEAWNRELAEIESRLEALGDHGTDGVDRVKLLNRNVVILLHQGRFEDILTLAIYVHKNASALLGADHPATLTSANNLAGAYISLGRHAEALALQEATLEMRRVALGADHPDTLASMNNLAQIYGALGRHAEALVLQEEVLEKSRAVLGADHQSTLKSMNNLACTYESLGRYAEAIAVHEATLEKRRAVLGADHPDTLTSMNNLSGTYESLGRYAEALALQETTLEKSREALGSDHPYTLMSMNNLATSYESEQRFSEAKDLYQRALSGLEKLLGSEHLNTRTVKANLERCLKSMAKQDH